MNIVNRCMVFLALGLFAFAIQESPAANGMPATVLTGETDITGVFPWVKSGKIVYQKCELPTGGLHIFFYKTTDGEYFFLPGQLDSINKLLASEVKKEDAMHFLDKEMTPFAKDMLSNPVASNRLVTDKYIEGREADEHEILKPLKVVEKNINARGNKWALNFCVVTKEAAIERWSISGTVDPLAVDMFCRKIIKPNGTLRKGRISL